MQSIIPLLEQKISEVIATYDLEDANVSVKIERPKDNMHGDFSSNIALQIAKHLKKNPFDLAQELATKIQALQLENIEKIEAAKPGFVNFSISKNYFQHILSTIDVTYGKSELGNGKRIMIEFGQPNTHKAFHVGHLKSAISGLSMVRLHENLGYEVIKANYFGDIGMHVAKTTWAFLQKDTPEGFAELDAHERMRYIDDCYVYGSNAFKDDPKAEAEIREINKEIYQEVDNEHTKTYQRLRAWSIEHQDKVWQSLGVVFDRQYPESEVYKEAIELVQKNQPTIFEESEGAVIYRGEKEGLTNWVFITSEGNPTYSAKDLALASKKFSEYPDLFKAIVTTSIEQKDYFKVIIKVLTKIFPQTQDRYFHIPFGWMLRGGRKFSSRMGGSIKGMDILNEVKELAGKKVDELNTYTDEEKNVITHAVTNAGLKFLILSHEFYKDFSYEPEQFLSFQGFSGPYILYSYARAMSILSKNDEPINEAYLMDSVFSTEDEQKLLKLLEQYPMVAETAGIDITPHIVCTYLYDLAQTFNQFYSTSRVLNAETDEDKHARLALVKATAQVLKNGLTLLGIETVEKM